ncbi:Trypanosome variant surface glycoprotein (A-type), putative [Trypanosoma equiperdum]|uniref:Trypanosome variant surface glycoprotein (A-type), putative n=1 Tax=Trypanosoma equiperdum TaxID=5694 RepID=A0A1G4I3S1_TRYEQ|nr:Trypanosome variant surface glycoprotein (A-type), putative [Trypanosoma equiperdum]
MCTQASSAVGTTLITAVMLFLPRGEAAAKKGLKKAAWQPLCKASEELAQLPSEINGKAQKALETTASLTKDGLRFAIYSAAAPAEEDSTAIAILGAYFTTQGLQIAQTAKETTIKNAIQTTQDAAYVKGRLDEFLKLAVQVRDGTDDGCLIESGTNANAHTSGSIGSVSCKLTTIPLATDHRSDPTITPSGFSGLRDPAADGRSHQETTPDCRLMSGDNTNGLGDNANTAAAVTHIDGYITAAADGTTEVTLADARTKNKLDAQANKAWHDLLTSLELKVSSEEIGYTNNSVSLR